MTTIVIDCQRKQVAADSQRTSYQQSSKGEVFDQTLHYTHDVQKIHIIRGVVLVGTGDSDVIRKEVKHFEEFGRLPCSPQGERTIAVAQRKGEVLHVDIHKAKRKRDWRGRVSWQSETSTVVSDTQFITLGSGADYAFAGMMSGMVAKDAVVLASKCDQYTNNNVVVVDL